MYCAELGSSTKPQVHLLARAAREQRTWPVCTLPVCTLPVCTLPVYTLPSAGMDTQKCSCLLTIMSFVHTGIQKKSLTRDQPSMFKKCR